MPVTVESLAEALKLPADALLNQLRDAGVYDKEYTSNLSPPDVMKLLAYVASQIEMAWSAAAAEDGVPTIDLGQPQDHTFESSTTNLLKQDDVKKALELIDDYMRRSVKFAGSTQPAIPRQDEWMIPIINKFNTDLTGFADYVFNLRETLPRNHRVADQLNETYRWLDARLQQQVRRERRERAAAAVQRKFHPKWTTKEREDYLDTLDKDWAARRMSALADAINASPRGRISTDERAELFAEFWAAVDEEIAEGRLPKP